MLDFIYTLLIAPLEYWMHAALVFAHAGLGAGDRGDEPCRELRDSADLHQGRELAGGRKGPSKEL